MDKRYILVNDETEAMETLSQLKRDGVDENDMYVIHGKGEKLVVIGTEVDVKTVSADDDSLKTNDEKGAWNRFTDFFTGDDRVEDALSQSALTEEEKRDVLTGVRSGKIAILVDEDYRDHYCKVCTEYKSSDDARIDREKTGYEPLVGTGFNNPF